jgi:hypothetical protein
MAKEKKKTEQLSPKEIAQDEINIIEQTAQATAEKTVFEFKKNGLLKENKQSAYQKTEILLYNYNNFKEAIENKFKQIDTIIVAGSNRKSSSITTYSNNNSIESKLEEERAEEQIAKIEKSIAYTQNFIKMIDDAVKKLENDSYYDIIRLKYFEGKTREEIADYFDNVDVSTISRNKSRLINKLKIDLFSDDVIIEMLY